MKIKPTKNDITRNIPNGCMFLNNRELRTTARQARSMPTQITLIFSQKIIVEVFVVGEQQ